MLARLGPFAGGKHQFLIRGPLRIRIPNPHQLDIGSGLRSCILRETINRSDGGESVAQGLDASLVRSQAALAAR
ncbi:MAG: hypothetical protein FJW37_09895 [Acidobacteria bacterium]|nr:hypothetical protein [Acidobacteriota bacterium]